MLPFRIGHLKPFHSPSDGENLILCGRGGIFFGMIQFKPVSKVHLESFDKLAKLSVANNKQLLDKVFVICRIINVEVRVI